MNCQDAREAYSSSEIGLTEWALGHAHVMQCVECQKERESLSLPVGSRQRVASPRAARPPRLRRLLSTTSTLSEQAAIKAFDAARTTVDQLGRVRGVVPVFVKLSERTAAGAIAATRLAMATAVGLLSRLHALLSASVTVSGRIVVRGFDGARVGTTRVVDLLARMRGLASVGVQVSERAATRAIGATRFGMAISVALLARLGVLLSTCLTGFGRAAMNGFEGTRVGATRVVSLLVQLRGPLAIFVKRSGRATVDVIGAAGAGIARTGHLLTRVRAPLAMSLTASGQAAVRVGEVALAAAPVLGRARVAVSGAAHLAFQRAARATIEVGRVGGTRGLGSLSRFRMRLSTAVTESAWSAGRLIAASRSGAVRLRDLLGEARTLSSRLLARFERAAVSEMAATWAVGRVVVTPSRRIRPILKVSTAVAGVAVLIAVTLASWPRPWWPADLMAQRDVGRPVERASVEPAAVPSLVQAPALKPVTAPEPAPTVVSPPDTPRAAMRPRPVEPQSAIPAPSRGSDPARSWGTASAPTSSPEAVQNPDAADSTAAIDWLLKGGGGRRRIENP